jgi:hypothetical protein
MEEIKIFWLLGALPDVLAKEENIYAQKHLIKKQIRRVISKKNIMLLMRIFPYIIIIS